MALITTETVNDVTGILFVAPIFILQSQQLDLGQSVPRVIL